MLENWINNSYAEREKENEYESNDSQNCVAGNFINELCVYTRFNDDRFSIVQSKIDP